MGRADYYRACRDVALGRDARAHVVGDPDSDTEQIDPDDCKLVLPGGKHERLHREIVVHAGGAPGSAAVSRHREAQPRLQLRSRGACQQHRGSAAVRSNFQADRTFG